MKADVQASGLVSALFCYQLPSGLLLLLLLFIVAYPLTIKHPLLGKLGIYA